MRARGALDLLLPQLDRRQERQERALEVVDAEPFAARSDRGAVAHGDGAIRVQGATQLLAVGGEVDVATAGVLAREIETALGRNAEAVVVDLSAVALFAVEGVRVLLDADRRARARGCRLVVIAGAGAARRVLLATDAKRWLAIAT